MKISYTLLRKFIEVDVPLAKQLQLLTDLGLEVEGCDTFEPVRGGLSGVVVGEVVGLVAHPDADKLRVATIEVGEEKPLLVVCGAPNIAKGQKVPVAVVGTTLYDKEGNPWKIKKSKIRGVESFGMVCAEDELGLGEGHDGIMVLDATLINGTPCATIFDIQNDEVIEIGLTPNRADAMSHWGVARDLKAVCDFQKIAYKWNFPEVDLYQVNNTSFPIDVEVEDTVRCPMYRGVTISNLTVKPSPEWLQRILKALGITPKNNLVDATNYILHEMGQPLHAFDADKIKGKVKVKTVEKGTKFTTLDGIDRELHEEDLMICDSEKPLCIGGVFGGINSGVTEDTKRVFLESAYFDPISIRKTAKRHTLNTDASFRYERGIDPEIGLFALKKAVLLIQEIAGGEVTSEIVEKGIELAEKQSVTLSYEKVNRLIGEVLPKEKIKSILTSLDIEIALETEEELSIIIPRYRVDVTRDVDVIEEILRVYGYNTIEIPSTLTSTLPIYQKKTSHHLEKIIAEKLVTKGFYETMNNSLTNPAYASLSKIIDSIPKVELLNPLGQDLSQMRTTLLFSLLEVIAFNSNRQQKDLRLFEFGKIYFIREDEFVEEKKLAVCLTGKNVPENWDTREEKVTFFTLKGMVNSVLERLGIRDWEEKECTEDYISEGLSYTFNEKPLVHLGVVKSLVTKSFSIDTEILFAEINWDLVCKKAFKKDVVVEEIPKFPSSRRDFSLLINQSVQFAEIEKLAFQIEKRVLQKVSLFDVYEGKNIPEGRKSYGVSFLFRDKKKTLTDNYIDKIMSKLKKELEIKLEVQLR